MTETSRSPYAYRTRSNASRTLSSDVRSMHTHSASRGGCVSPPSRSKPTIRKVRARRRTTARPMKPLLPVTTTTPAESRPVTDISDASRGHISRRALRSGSRCACSHPRFCLFRDSPAQETPYQEQQERHQTTNPHDPHRATHTATRLSRSIRGRSRLFHVAHDPLLARVTLSRYCCG